MSDKVSVLWEWQGGTETGLRRLYHRGSVAMGHAPTFCPTRGPIASLVRTESVHTISHPGKVPRGKHRYVSKRSFWASSFEYWGADAECIAELHLL